MWRRRFDLKSRMRGLTYPWWVALFSEGLQILLVVAAATQRWGEGNPVVLVGAVALMVLPHVLQASTDRWIPVYVLGTCALACGGLLMTVPVGDGIDLAPAALAVVGAQVTAMDGVRYGIPYSLVAGVLVFVDDPAQTQPSVGEVALGFMVGAMLWWQARSLLAERRARRREGDTAALAERQRIARDVHDLLAHSLSVTLLQVGGARRALLDHDLEEADQALGDAETAARTAMDEIRRTVGLLADRPGPSHPVPDAVDLPALVEHVGSAGLDVDLSVTGDLGSLPPSVGLTVYRVAQEALTNAVRHAGDVTTTVVVQVTSRDVRLVVANPLLSGRSRTTGSGHGLRSMAERAEQVGGRVRVGARDSRWIVELVVPTTRPTAPPGSTSSVAPRTVST